MNKDTLFKIAGSLWGIIGLFLIFRGAHLYQLAIEQQSSSQNAVILSLAAGMLIGFFKGKFVLSKTARKNKERIQQLQPPIKAHQVFSKPFYFFIGGMMLLGYLLRTWNEYLGGYIVVAAIYCGIGLALIVASRAYWTTNIELPEVS